MPAHKVRRITAIANSHDGAFLYSGSSSGRLRLSDLRKKNRIGTFYNWIRDLYLPHRLGKKNWGPIADLAVSPGNEILYSLISYGLIEFVDLKTGKIVRPLKFEDSSPARFVLSHDGKILFIGLHDGSIEEVDVNTRKIIRSRDPHQDSVTALALSPEGNILYSASDDKTIGIWNLKTGESFQVPFVDQINFGQLVSLEVTPDGRRLFLVKDTGDAFVLDLERAHPHWIEKEDAR
jgi:WD40 repeat protein